MGFSLYGFSTGREWDDESGLYFYRARYYNPEIGRFISEDPIGFEGGINFYNYVGGNPINFIDPFGFYRKCNESFKNCFDRCLDEQHWVTEGLRQTADDLGLVGLESVAVSAVSAVTGNAVAGTITAASNTAKIAPVTKGGSIVSKLATSSQSSGMIGRLSSMSAAAGVVAKASGIITAVATAASLLLRAECVFKCRN